MTDDRNTTPQPQPAPQVAEQPQQAPAPQSAPQPQPQEPVHDRPAATLRDGNLQASIWRNEGEKGPYYSTTYSRSYQDQEGNYRDSSSFVGADNLKVAELARQAYNRSNELRRAAFKQQREAETQDRRAQQHDR